MQHSSNHDQRLIDQRAVVSATAGLSPVPGRVRVVLDITPEAAYDLAYRCTSPHLAGFAGALGQAAFWARWGAPATATRGAGIMPQRMANDPGE